VSLCCASLRCVSLYCLPQYRVSLCCVSLYVVPCVTVQYAKKEEDNKDLSAEAADLWNLGQAISEAGSGELLAAASAPSSLTQRPPAVSMRSGPFPPLAWLTQSSPLRPGYPSPLYSTLAVPAFTLVLAALHS